MKEYVIESFKYGYDTRRDVLTSQPGTLVLLENAVVNPGGEVEKSKKISEFADVSVLDTNGDQGTFGVEVTSAGIIVFGSAIVNGGAVTLSQPTLVSAMPAGVTYQQLKHPAIYDGETYDRTKHRMTRLKFSDNYQGNSFACALYADGNTFAYSNGVLVEQSRNGIVLANHTTSLELSQDLVAQIERIPGWDGNAENLAYAKGRTTIKSPVGVSFTPIPTETSTVGTIGVAYVAGPSAGTPAGIAYASFQVTGTIAGTITITAPSAADGTGSVTLVNGETFSPATQDGYAQGIVDKINEFTNIHGYTALFQATGIFIIYPPISWAKITSTFNVTVTGSGGAILFDGVSVTLTYGATVAPTSQTIVSPQFSTFTSQTFTATAVGGTAPYTYQWERTSGSALFNPTTPTSATTSFTGSTQPGTTSAHFRCKVTDAGSVVTYSNIITVTTVTHH